MVHALRYNYIFFIFAFKAIVILYIPFLLISSSNKEIASEGDLVKFICSDCVEKDYAPDIAIAALVKIKTKKVSSFIGYKDYLDSLLTDSYKTALGWCNIIEENNSKLKKYYLKKNLKKDYFLQYYEERCIKPIKEFEYSTTFVNFSYTYVSPRCRREACGGVYSEMLNVSAIKTETGALAKYSLTGSRIEEPEYLEAELSMKEWQDFIRTLYKCDLTKLKGFENSDIEGRGWRFLIHSIDKEVFLYGDHNTRPSNWNELKKALDNLDLKIRKKTRTEIGESPWWWSALD